MKLQEVILRALAKKIIWWQAAEILESVIGTCVVGGNVTKNLDMTGCTKRRLGKVSPRRLPMAQLERVLELYRERYFDLNVKHFHEKLKPEYQIEVSYTWLKLALRGAELVNCREKIRSRLRLSGHKSVCRARLSESGERIQLAKIKHLTDSRFAWRQTFELACFLAVQG